jgi:hypothetical protein
MSFAIVSITWATLILSESGPVLTSGSYLLFPARPGPHDAFPTRVEPYTPEEGDVVLFNDQIKIWKKLYHFVGSEPPDHSGIIFKFPDGMLALVESGPDNGQLSGLRVRIIEATSRLHCYQGTLWVRRLKKPLTPEQSARLTEFAMAQEGKRYAVGRLLLQGTPFRCRGTWRNAMFGKTDLDRGSWLCSELVVAAGTVAGIFDPNVHHANAIYPRDLFLDDKYDLSQVLYPAGIWSYKQDDAPESCELARHKKE